MIFRLGRWASSVPALISLRLLRGHVNDMLSIIRVDGARPSQRKVVILDGRTLRYFKRMPDVFARLHLVIFTILMLPRAAILLAAGASS